MSESPTFCATAGGIGPISYADLEVLGCKVATKQLWRKIKVSKAKVSATLMQSYLSIQNVPLIKFEIHKVN